MKSLATPGVSQYNINPTTLAKRLLVPVPTLDEQRAVVTCLESWDGAIARLNALISRKIDLKQGLMQQLLRGGRRFEEFVVSDSTYQTRYGSFPADWPYTQIRAIAHEVNARSSDPTSTTVLSCTKYEGLVDSLEYFGKRVFSDDTAQYKLVRRDQFAYATNHIEEGSIGLLSHRDAGLVSPMYTVFKTNDHVHPPFLYALFKTDLYRQIFQANTNASVDRRGGLRWQEFALLHVALPGKGEQRKIAAFLTDFQREIQLLNRERDLLEKEKRWLLDKLAFGHLRLDAQRSVDYEQRVASDREVTI
jgi:type I restriction enzyme S subunit